MAAGTTELLDTLKISVDLSYGSIAAMSLEEVLRTISPLPAAGTRNSIAGTAVCT